MSDDQLPTKRRGRPRGSTKRRARPIVDKIASTRGFDHLLVNPGYRGAPGRAGIQSPGEFLFGLLVEGTAASVGVHLSPREIKRAIRNRRRASKKSPA